jgi:subtilisin family serine protease
MRSMSRYPFFVFALVCALCAVPAQASSRVIVRVNGGASVLHSLCALLSCNVEESIGDPLGQVFLITSRLGTDTLITELTSATGVIDCEPDQLAKVTDSTSTVPVALTDSTPVTYYGQTVPHGYVAQPAVGIVRLADAQAAFGVTGAGEVAVIDTGVDPDHPVLSGVLLAGYDFTRDQSGASERNDVTFPNPPGVGNPHRVNSKAVANVTQSTAAVVDGSGAYGAFGHGTMVAGIIHLVAPSSMILPIKVFGSDGTGNLSDILRAIYLAARSGVQVINMSFSFSSYSPEVKNAINHANRQGIICVAAAGNDGQQTTVYPAALTNLVMGVASTTDTDQLSSFSNYGPQIVWVGAPGEGIVSTYPFGTYAAGWGTSFSTPLVAGTAALLWQSNVHYDESSAAQAIAHAVTVNSNLGNGRLDIYQAVREAQ